MGCEKQIQTTIGKKCCPIDHTTHKQHAAQGSTFPECASASTCPPPVSLITIYQVVSLIYLPSNLLTYQTYPNNLTIEISRVFELSHPIIQKASMYSNIPVPSIQSHCHH